MGAVLTVLGAGSSLPRAGYGPSGYALRPEPGGPVTLFDCGPGSVRSLGAVEIALDEVERVVLSHYHLDHCADLLALAFARRNPHYRDRLPAIELIGPHGLQAFLDGARALAGKSADFGEAVVHEVDPAGGTLAVRGLELRWAPTGHTANAVAWRARTQAGESMAYSGDSGEVPALAELARGVDLFLCECSFADSEGVSNHLTPSGAARTAALAGVGGLVLTHFYPGLDPEHARREAAKLYTGPLAAARDGARYPLAMAHLAQ